MKRDGCRKRQIEEFMASGLDKMQVDRRGADARAAVYALRKAIKTEGYPVKACRRGDEVWLYHGDKNALGLHRTGKWCRWIEEFLASGESFTVLKVDNVPSVTSTMCQARKKHGYPIGISQSRDEIWVCRRKSNGTV